MAEEKITRIQEGMNPKPAAQGLTTLSQIERGMNPGPIAQALGEITHGGAPTPESAAPAPLPSSAVPPPPQTSTEG